MSEQNKIFLLEYAKTEFGVNGSFEELEKKLLQKTNDQELISEIIKELKREIHSRKLKNGSVKLGVGAVLLIIGFLITCVNFHSNTSFSFIMYSFTTLGLILMFWGLYDIIG